jgi:hypothetical protein
VKRRPVIVLAVGAAIASIPVALHVAAPAAAPHVALPVTQACGYDRWNVKTLQDRPRLFQTEESTVRALGVFPRPSSLPSTRLAQEQHVYVVTADVIAIQSETDGDLHVILRAGGRTMISEAPNSACTTQARPFRRLQMQQARESVRICQARVAGVLFFDFAVGQYGHSPNYAELHPLLVFHCLYPLPSVRPRTDSPLEQLLPSLPRP